MKIVDEIKNCDKVFEKLKNQNYMLTKIFILQQGTSYWKWFLIKREKVFWKWINWIFCKLKDLWKALKSLCLPNKISPCKVKVLKINNAVEVDVSTVFKGSKNFNSSLVENLGGESCPNTPQTTQ